LRGVPVLESKVANFLNSLFCKAGFRLKSAFLFCSKPFFEFIQTIIRLLLGRIIMQKIFIIFAVIILSSITSTAQMKLRDLQTITDDPTDSAQTEIKDDSTKPVNFVELNRLGVQKALVEKDYQQAIEFFTKAVEAAPDCFRCKFNLGRSFLIVEKYDDAIKIFNELVVVNPNSSDLYASLGETYNTKGLYDQSLSYFRQSLKLNPNDPVTLSNYAISLSMLGKYGEALENLDKSIKLHPDFVEALSNKGYALFQLGRPKDALETLKKAEKLNPNIAQVHNNLGVVLDQMGKKKEAKTHYEKAVELKSDYGEAICNLALTNLEEGNRDAAYRQLKTLEKIDFKLAEQLRGVIWGKYVVDASKVKERD
jgi:tetratricopeptide (TPR) repeat protein